MPNPGQPYGASQSLPADQLAVRAAQQDDVDQLVALDALSFSRFDRYPRREWAALVAESLAGDAVTILVAQEAAANIVGAVAIVADPRTLDVNIASVATAPHYRRTGLASRLLFEALRAAPPQLTTASLEVRADNAAARALYEKLGFTLTRRIPRYYADGAAAFEYQAPLSVVQARAGRA